MSETKINANFTPQFKANTQVWTGQRYYCAYYRCNTAIL